jgi:hypothetical protein
MVSGISPFCNRNASEMLQFYEGLGEPYDETEYAA